MGDCWIGWEDGSWVGWCGDFVPPVPPAREEVHLLEPFYVWDERKELKRREEEAILIL